MKESDVQRQILDYLALKRIFRYRNNSGAFIDSQKHVYRFGAVGGPNIVCVSVGQCVGIGMKRPGEKQSDHQKDFQEKLQEGGRYVIAPFGRRSHCRFIIFCSPRDGRPVSASLINAFIESSTIRVDAKMKRSGEV